MNSLNVCALYRHCTASAYHILRFAVLLTLCVVSLQFAGSEVNASPPINPPLPFVWTPSGPDFTVLNDGAGILKSRQWALVLGKALFWDERVGSEGIACASCHFHAGADTRLTNQLSPGLKDVTKGPEGDQQFGSDRSTTGTVDLGDMPSGTRAEANYTLTPEDLPLHRLQDETDRNSAIITTTNDRVSSQGAFDALFTKIPGQSGKEHCGDAEGEIYHTQSGLAVRQVEPRNTPSVINAVFYHRNFWDGRANNLFNGVGVFGMRDILFGDPNRRLLILDTTGVPQLGFLQLENASLASQAVGPLLSVLEMSCADRTLADIGRKLLTDGIRPLQAQNIDPRDSVLGLYAQPNDKGLRLQYTYKALIRKAFDEKYWAAAKRYRISGGTLTQDPNGYTQMEINFPMFWGIAVMLYESTLVSDQAEFDQVGVTDAASCLTSGPDALFQRGCQIFFSGAGAGPVGNGIGGNCSTCHGGTIPGTSPAVQAALSSAAFQVGQTFSPLTQVGKSLGGSQRRDGGFIDIGLRPVFTDQMNGSTDPYGKPLSFVRQYQNFLQDGTPVVDPFLQRVIDANGPFGFGVTPGVPAPTLGTDGAGKAPILRNVALTPPYFSSGGFGNLRQVMKFYNRGSNRRDITGAGDPDAQAVSCLSGDDSGTGPDGDQAYALTGVTDCNSNTPSNILPLGLSDCEAPDGSLPKQSCINKAQTVENDDLAALVRFLTALTDPRVQCSQAPFDHPSLHVVTGHVDQDKNHDGRADDIIFELPAVGAGGYAATSGFCIPNAGDLFAPGMQATSGGPQAP